MMTTQRELFLKYQAQTSEAPLMLEIDKANGIYLYDINGKEYIDLISGISVSNLGHRHPKVIKAIKDQLDKYTYLMVYGEYIQSPQVKLATILAKNLPENLNSTYFVNSGSESVEGALKLAKRYTGRSEIVSFKKAYHGSTHGCLSIIGDDYFKQNFGPLLPNVTQLEFNNIEELDKITDKTACVIIECIQGEAGIIKSSKEFLKNLRKRCNETGCLLIIDEIQTGFGRTGTLFSFEQFGVVPDILCIAKGMGGGMPIGAFISSNKIMNCLTNNPVLGHITTFGGHPVCCASALANLEVLLDEDLISKVKVKENLFLENINHSSIIEKRSFGLMISLEFDSFELNKKIIDKCIENGVITDWFLFNSNSMRIAPPLIITNKQILETCNIINTSIIEIVGK